MKRGCLAVGCLVPAAASGFVCVFMLLIASNFSVVTPTTTTDCVDNTTATGQLTAGQIAAADYAAGVRNGNSGSPDANNNLTGTNVLTIFVALTMPESGANASAVQQGQPYSTTGWGVYQVTPGDSEPQCGVDQALLNLNANVCAAVAKLKSQGLTAWTTFSGGEYLEWMGWAANGVATMSTAGLSCQAPQVTSAAVDASVTENGQPVEQTTPPGLPDWPSGVWDSYYAGQCTYWVALHFPTPPGLGNAYQWFGRAAADGLPESQTPVAGGVVVYGPGGGYSEDGHVAFVLQVNADGTFVVSEMNFMGIGIVDERTSTMADVEGFIDP